MSIKFKCLKCGCEKLEEVMYGVTQFSLIDSLDEDGAIDYTMNGISYEDGNVQYYQCNKCGFIVGDKDYKVNCEDELVEWLKANCEQDAPYIDPRYTDDNVKNE